MKKNDPHFKNRQVIVLHYSGVFLAFDKVATALKVLLFIKNNNVLLLSRDRLSVPFYACKWITCIIDVYTTFGWCESNSHVKNFTKRGHNWCVSISHSRRCENELHIFLQNRSNSGLEWHLSFGGSYENDNFFSFLQLTKSRFKPFSFYKRRRKGKWLNFHA